MKYSLKLSWPTNLQWNYILTLLLMGLVWWILYLQSPRPIRLRFANVGTQSFAVTWLTSQSINGCVAVWDKTLLPQRVCESDASQAHLVTIEGLEENHTYRIMIYSGKWWYPFTFSNVQTFVSGDPVLPRPGYGTVIDLKGKSVGNALVYVYPRISGVKYPEAVKANEAGNFAIDLGIFDRAMQDFVLEGGSGPEQWNALPVGGATAPFPPLEVSVYE